MKKTTAVSVDEQWLGWADEQVQNDAFPSRSALFEAALQALYDKQLDEQLQRSLDALTPADVGEQQALAETGMYEYGEQLRDYPW